MPDVMPQIHKSLNSELDSIPIRDDDHKMIQCSKQTLILVMLFISSLYGCAHKGPRIENVMIRYDPKAEQPWPGIKEAVEVLQEQLAISYPKPVWRDLIIEVSASDGLCISPFVPSGMARCQSDPSKQCPVNGTIRREPGFLAFSFTPVICVRQIRDAQGKLYSAGVSALFHEGCEHTGPFETTSHLNWIHAPEYKKCTQAADKLYLSRTRTSSIAPQATMIDKEMF